MNGWNRVSVYQESNNHVKGSVLSLSIKILIVQHPKKETLMYVVAPFIDVWLDVLELQLSKCQQEV